MQAVLEWACLVVFFFLMAMPGVYGLHLYALMLLSARRRRGVRAQQRAVVAEYTRDRAEADWPTVTTQLPIYNELAVVRRLLPAVARIDYPAGKHEIQVLDDSTDETRQVVDELVAELQAEGVDIKVVRRPTRTHYKAGALAYGAARAKGEYIAIFDADFVPQEGFLRRMIPLVDSDAQACCVQGRWGHLNQFETWITDGLSVGMDGHFVVEQGGRAWNDFLLNFNGTAGIWRRSAIDDPRVGGWSGDTITEDLDLSYRAQLAGWKIIYNVDEIAPAEIPADVPALKAQQRRWATGSIQTAVKLLPTVWRSQRLSVLQKLEGTIHLTQYTINVWMLLMVLFGRVLLSFVSEELYQPLLASSWWLILAAALAPSVSYMYARWAVGGGLIGPVKILKLMTLGMGLSVNNTLAVLTGLVQKGGEFVRTPKSGNLTSARLRLPQQYATIRSRMWLLEIILGAFCLAQWAIFLQADRYVGGSFLLIFGIGLLLLGWQSRPRGTRGTSTAATPEVKTAAARGLMPQHAKAKAVGSAMQESARVAPASTR